LPNSWMNTKGFGSRRIQRLRLSSAALAAFGAALAAFGAANAFQSASVLRQECSDRVIACACNTALRNFSRLVGFVLNIPRLLLMMVTNGVVHKQVRRGLVDHLCAATP